MANLINAVNPDVIAIGGGLANMGDVLLAPACEAVRFAPAELGGHSGVVAAAADALQEAEV